MATLLVQMCRRGGIATHLATIGKVPLNRHADTFASKVPIYSTAGTFDPKSAGIAHRRHMRAVRARGVEIPRARHIWSKGAVFPEKRHIRRSNSAARCVVAADCRHFWCKSAGFPRSRHIKNVPHAAQNDTYRI